jgi:hypothetical protein
MRKIAKFFTKQHLVILITILSGGIRFENIFKILKVMFVPDLVAKIRYNRNKKFKVYYYNDSHGVNCLKIDFYERRNSFFNPWLVVNSEELLVYKREFVSVYKEVVSKYYNKSWDDIIKISERNKKINSLLS